MNSKHWLYIRNRTLRSTKYERQSSAQKSRQSPMSQQRLELLNRYWLTK
jgi:very-short-patch-repair endonuclease